MNYMFKQKKKNPEEESYTHWKHHIKSYKLAALAIINNK